MKIPAEVLAVFPPSAEALLDRARRGFDDDMLLIIARADYGERAPEMLVELRRIRDHGTVPTFLDGQLIEVLQLTCWSNPDRPNPPPFEPGPTGRRGHHIRLFACAALLSAMAEGNYNSGPCEAILAQCLVSAKVLGDEFNEAAARFLTWAIPQMDHDSPLFALAVLILAIRLRSKQITDSVLKIVTEWIFGLEAVSRQQLPVEFAEPPPLPFGILSGFWHSLAVDLVNESAAICTPDVRENVCLCALLLHAEM